MGTEKLQDVHYISTLINSLSSYNGNNIHEDDKSHYWREKYFPSTLGDITALHNNLFHPLRRNITFSPPAFGLTKHPGDFFEPWQCVLAEEAPALATTVFRNAMDREDFDRIIDEGGNLIKPHGTMSSRRYHPKDKPPTALGYLKRNIESLLEDVRAADMAFDRTVESSMENPVSQHSLSYLNAFKDEPCRDCNFIQNADLVFSPVHNELMEKRLQRFELEEALLNQAEKLDEIEKNRSPVPRWYMIKTPQFFYEARKYNQLLKSRNNR